MHEIDFITIGDRKALELPDSLVSQANLRNTDRVQAFASPAGVLICKVDSESVSQIEIAQQVMEDRRDALRRLAE